MNLSEKAEKRVREIRSLYPEAKSAVMPALFIAQEELGWISQEAVDWVAERIGVSPAHVRSVASFYTMYYKRPVGKYHIQLCRTLSCSLAGTPQLIEYVRTRLGVGPHEVAADGLWSYEEVECLGSCGTGPAAQINDLLFERLTPGKLAAVMDRIEQEAPDIRYSTLREQLGGGLLDLPRSELGK